MDCEKLAAYFAEADKHKEHIIEAKEELSLPIESYEALSKLEKFALNTLIFRFSKLQDLIGAKIMRVFLSCNEFPVEEMGFFDILKEIEKEGIVDIDTWSQLRELRNDIAHEYPEEMEEVIAKINLLIDRSDSLIAIVERLERQYREIERKRD